MLTHMGSGGPPRYHDELGCMRPQRLGVSLAVRTIARPLVRVTVSRWKSRGMSEQRERLSLFAALCGESDRAEHKDRVAGEKAMVCITHDHWNITL